MHIIIAGNNEEMFHPVSELYFSSSMTRNGPFHVTCVTVWTLFSVNDLRKLSILNDIYILFYYLQ